ncbi:terminase large subunit domain-containing protein [Peptostreptococcus porci]|uniref:terminase large subunit domain-containing protein n=1 Tax=Peptostreptococcus porci TaxID=2652282 RepID=UPI002A82C61C|nr:terminase family protein [Peptostreptococcus porci]MDY4127632.1 hypothetical protein [Peptostreptococcus porci]
MNNKISKPRKNIKSDQKENLIEGGKLWTEFYRKNIEIFAEQYLNVKLFIFQKIILHMMSRSNFFCWVACRGLGKSFLTAIYCVCMAILYPGIKIVIAAGQKSQADSVITEKIAELMNNSPTLSAEIEPRGIRTYHNNVACHFRNGSKITSIAANQGARGQRCNILLIDEYRMVDKLILDQVLKPFLTNRRTPPFYFKPEYENYPKDSNKELYLSSAWLKSHWSWGKFNDIIKMMIDGKQAVAIDIDYHCSLDHGLITQEKIDEDRVALGEFSFDMEYRSIFWGENANSFYKSAELNDCRVLKNAYYPLTDDEYRCIDIKKKRLKQMPRKNGEIRIIGVDFARMGSNKNDNSVYTLMRLLPNGDSFKREVVYMEAFNGMKSEDQATRIKRLYTEFECDKLIIDGNGNGVALIDEMQKSSYDFNIDEHYDAFGVYDSNVATEFEPIRDGNNCIYLMKAFEKANNDVIVYLKNALLSKKIRLLIDETTKESSFKGDKKFFDDAEYHANMILPFIQTSQFIFETLNLEYEDRSNGNIAIKNTSKRKDRFSSLAYANYLAELIEKEEYKKRNTKSGGFMFFN